jgi:hypothetical protein
MLARNTRARRRMHILCHGVGLRRLLHVSAGHYDQERLQVSGAARGRCKRVAQPVAAAQRLAPVAGWTHSDHYCQLHDSVGAPLGFVAAGSWANGTCPLKSLGAPQRSRQQLLLAAVSLWEASILPLRSRPSP